MQLTFIIDPIAKLDPTHDTSVALMEALVGKGHTVWITEGDRLSVIEGKTWGRLQRVTIHPVTQEGDRWMAPTPWYTLHEETFQPLEDTDVVWMRVDPPVDVPYLYTTYLLDAIDPTKTLVLNHPHGLRSANEKMFALQFAKWMPATIVSRDKDVIRDFVKWHNAGVLKPLGGKGGEGILFLETDDRNLNSLVEISTDSGRVPVMVQQFLSAAKDGDKRIILLDGEPIGAVNRIPTGREFRGNMAVGGRAAAAVVTDSEREMCAEMAPILRKFGLYFVGIDVIGGYLTEVNVTSPTGLREIDRLDGVRTADRVISWLEQRSA
jgi:glutathione synthase